MLNRRHIRVKVMQSIYAMHQQHASDLDKQERFLYKSIEDILDLYLIVISSLIEIKAIEEDFLDKSSKKLRPTKEEANPNFKFVTNPILQELDQSNALSIALAERKIKNWTIDDSYLKIVLKAIKESELYLAYLAKPHTTFNEDQEFLIQVFTEIIAPNEKFNEYLEDQSISFIDDIPIVNTLVLKQLSQFKAEQKFKFTIPKIYKDADDKDFAKQLLRKVILRDGELCKEYADKTPNWDTDRIAELDTIILKMAIAELLHFPSIPVKVTINEYVEIAKEYATPKSSIFINGILDKLSKEYLLSNKAVKVGRGLL